MKILYLLKKEFIEIFRQKELLPLIFIAPVIMIIVLGYVVKTDIEHLPVKVINLSKSKSTARIINRMKNTPLFDIKELTTENQGHLEALKRGKVKAIIIFRDSHQNIVLNTPEIQVLMDGIDSNTSLIAAGYFNGIIKKFILDDMKTKGMKLPLENRTLIRFNPELKSITYMGPGIVALLLTILSLFLTSVSIVREKEQQTMDTLLISRLTSFEIYLGKALPMAIIGLLEMVLGIFIVMLWFQIPIRGNLLYLFLAALVFLSAILSYALLISTITSTQQQALFFSWFTIVTFILLSGLFTPVENIPPGLRILADINPVRYLIKIIREIFLKGNGIEFFYPDLLCLMGIASVIIVMSTITFKRFISK